MYGCDLDKRTLRRLLPGTIEEELSKLVKTKKIKYTTATFNSNNTTREMLKNGEKEIEKKRMDSGSGMVLSLGARQLFSVET